jgi:ribosomal protein S18 acetylase RimI-like enzyme
MLKERSVHYALQLLDSRFDQMRIRTFSLRDYEEVVELWKRAGLILRPGDDLEGVKLKLKRDPDLFLVSEDVNHEIIGVVMGAWDGRRGWINHLAVRPDRQREGVGKALTDELEMRLFRRGAAKVNAQVYKWNRNSINFFKSRGYQVHSELVMIGKMLRKG